MRYPERDWSPSSSVNEIAHDAFLGGTSTTFERRTVWNLAAVREQEKVPRKLEWGIVFVILSPPFVS